METKDIISIIEGETLTELRDSDMKLALFDVGIDSFKLIRIVYKIEQKYNIKLSSIFENDEKFDSVEDFINKLQNEIGI